MNTRPQLQNKNLQKWKSVIVTLKEDELAVLDTNLNLNDFKTFSEFIHAWIHGQYPAHENNEQVEKLLENER